MNKNYRVSVVIPVYNEEDSLAACLDAIAAQSVQPYEVIVVDNNSVDASAAIAARYPFVTIIRENRQGLVHARNCGFDAASGDIIGRIDADTLLPSNWVGDVRRIFADERVDAVSGSIVYRDILFTDFFARIELFFRQWVASGFTRSGFLYGGNMAMRRTAWQQVRGRTCNHKGLHEDLDLGIHTAEAGGRIVFDGNLRAEVHLRRFDTSFGDFWQWAWLTPRTYSRHGLHEQGRIYCVAALATLFYLPIKLLHKGYDPVSDTFSVQRLFEPTVARVNPATFGE